MDEKKLRLWMNVLTVVLSLALVVSFVTVIRAALG